MTKTEILKRIENTSKLQQKAIETVNELIESVSMSDAELVLAAVLHTANGCICDMMNNIALILCEMLSEKEDDHA